MDEGPVGGHRAEMATRGWVRTRGDGRSEAVRRGDAARATEQPATGERRGRWDEGRTRRGRRSRTGLEAGIEFIAGGARRGRTARIRTRGRVREFRG